MYFHSPNHVTRSTCIESKHGLGINSLVANPFGVWYSKCRRDLLRWTTTHNAGEFFWKMSFMEILLLYGISGDGGANAGDLHKRQLSGSYFEQQWVAESTDGPSSVSDLGGLVFVSPLYLQKWDKVLVYGERSTLSFVSNFRRWWFCVSWAVTV